MITSTIPTNLVSSNRQVALEGILPLTPQIRDWMTEACSTEMLDIAMTKHGSPLNIVNPDEFENNVSDLEAVADRAGIDFKIFFARKANKCLSFVDRAAKLGIGVDTASLQEVNQCLDRGVRGKDIVCTAAIKSNALIEKCIDHGVLLVVDNYDEFAAIANRAKVLGKDAIVALRLSDFAHSGTKALSRFGISICELDEFLASIDVTEGNDWVSISGLHFHLDGYSAQERIEALSQCLDIVDLLNSTGYSIGFVDIGGGFPVCYLDDTNQWERFDKEHRNALEGKRSEITYRNHALGLSVVDGGCHGTRRLYPFHHAVTAPDWLNQIFEGLHRDDSIATALNARNLELRCEPGRALLNGAGMTIARVEFTKRLRSGDILVGLAMNRTQCRTGSDDFMIDFLHLPVDVDKNKRLSVSSDSEGYLVGAYCTESELISLRKLRIPSGLSRGDMVMIPNTAGYFMHFLESRSHQLPLAKNFIIDLIHHQLTPDPIK